MSYLEYLWLYYWLQYTWGWGCFTKLLRVFYNDLAKIHNARNHIYGVNFKLNLCMFAQSMSLGARLSFQLELLISNMISAMPKFRENILEMNLLLFNNICISEILAVYWPLYGRGRSISIIAHLHNPVCSLETHVVSPSTQSPTDTVILWGLLVLSIISNLYGVLN